MAVHQLEEIDGGQRCTVCGQSWKKRPGSECPGVKVYGWGKWPDNLLTKKQMDDAGLQTGQKLPPVAGVVHRDESPGGWMRLYDRNAGVPKRQLSEAQKAASQQSAAKLHAGWTCQRCGHRLRRFRQYDGYCDRCADHNKVVRWAKAFMDAQPPALILDTETTGLDAGYHEICQIAVIDTTGAVLLDTYVNVQYPERVYEFRGGALCAHDIHGITPAMLADAPTWPEVYQKLIDLCAGRELAIYNSEFDMGMIEGDCKRHGLLLPGEELDAYCAMTWYAAWYGKWSTYHHDYWWHPLDAGHTALEDCQVVLALMKQMAEG